jgi:hypothetical protein
MTRHIHLEVSSDYILKTENQQGDENSQYELNSSNSSLSIDQVKSKTC